MAISEIPSLHLKPVAYKTNKLYLKLPEGSIGNMTFARTSIARRDNNSGLVEEVATGIPRLDYPLINGVVQSCPDLLLEPTRTNICLRSEEFENASWVDNAQMTVTANVTVSPDGTKNADKIVYNDDGGSGIKTQNITVIDATDYEISIYMKGQIGGEKVKIDFKNTISAGTGGTEVTLTTEWVRYTENLTSTATDRGFQIRCTAGNGSQTFYVWGSQMELGDYRTTYIKTIGSSVTRATEVCNSGGDSTTFNSLEGVLYAEIATLGTTPFGKFITISDGTTSNQVLLGINSSNQVLGFIRVGGVISANMTFSVTATDFNSCALKFKNNDFALWVNGVEVVTDNLGGSFSLNILDELSFDDGGGGDPFNGIVKEIKVFKTALTDEELEELTT